MIEQGRTGQAWALEGREGQTVTIDLISDEFDCYLYVIGLFVLVTSLLVKRARERRQTMQSRKEVALVVATWMSLLAPLSWYVVFKAHSVIHVHISCIVWHMPFVLLGAASCGLWVEKLGGNLFGRSPAVAER